MKQEENKYSRIQYFLWLVAGSEISVLKKCPNDYNRHANIGLMIIITSLFACSAIIDQVDMLIKIA